MASLEVNFRIPSGILLSKHIALEAPTEPLGLVHCVLINCTPEKHCPVWESYRANVGRMWFS